MLQGWEILEDAPDDLNFAMFIAQHYVGLPLFLSRNRPRNFLEHTGFTEYVPSRTMSPKCKPSGLPKEG